MKSDSKNDTSGKNPTNTRGKETQKITFSTTYLRAAGVDPLAQYNEWCGEIGKAYPLYVGGAKFGPAKMELTAVDIADSTILPNGVFTMLKLSLTLTEDTTGKSTTATRKTTTSTSTASTSASTKAAAKYKETVAAKKEAMNATASKSDKAEKKTSKGGGSR